MTGWGKHGQKEKSSSGNKLQGFQGKWNYPELQQREGQTPQPQAPRGTGSPNPTDPHPAPLDFLPHPTPVSHSSSIPGIPTLISCQEFPAEIPCPKWHCWEVVPCRSWSNLQTLIKPWQHPGVGGDCNCVFNYINSAQGGQ